MSTLSSLTPQSAPAFGSSTVVSLEAVPSKTTGTETKATPHPTQEKLNATCQLLVNLATVQLTASSEERARKTCWLSSEETNAETNSETSPTTTVPSLQELATAQAELRSQSTAVDRTSTAEALEMDRQARIAAAFEVTDSSVFEEDCKCRCVIL